MLDMSNRVFINTISKKKICESFVFCHKKLFPKKEKEVFEHFKFISERIDDMLKYKIINVIGAIEELKSIGIKSTFFECITNSRCNREVTLNRIQRRNQLEFRASLIALKNNLRYLRLKQ